MSDNFHALDTESELITILKQLDSESLDRVLYRARVLLMAQQIRAEGISWPLWNVLPWWLRLKITLMVWWGVTWGRVKKACIKLWGGV